MRTSNLSNSTGSYEIGKEVSILDGINPAKIDTNHILAGSTSKPNTVCISEVQNIIIRYPCLNHFSCHHW